MKLHPYLRRKASRSRQDGYILIVMLLFLALMAIGLTVMAPALAQRVRREREIELIHRGRQYARAIRLFYRKFGRYPGRLEELENTNNIRFLRKRFKDPMTPSGQWRLIHYGEAQLAQSTVTPVLPGAATPGSPGFGGSSSSSSPFASTFSSSSQPGTGQAGTVGTSGGSSPFANTFSGSSQPGSGQASMTSSQTAATPDQSGTTPGQTGTTPSASADSSQSSQSGGQPGQPGTPTSQLSAPLGTGPTFGGGPVVGVASTSKKESIKIWNKKTHYNEWEFVFDPSLDLTMAAAAAGVPGQNPLAPGVQTPGAQTPGVQTLGAQAPTTPPAATSPATPGMPAATQ